MHEEAANGSGVAGPRSGAPFIPWTVGLVVASAVAVLWLTGGGLGYRSVADLDGKVPIGQEIRRVRIELQNGTVGVADVLEAGDRTLSFAGGVRRAADTAEQLQELEKVPFQPTHAIDPSQPDTLVLRGARLPPGSTGLLAYELAGMRVPADLALEVVIEGNGHVTVAQRRGAIDVRTGRGDLRFERCSAPVRAKTGRGYVIAFDHMGDLDLHTEVGDMQAFLREPGTLLRLSTGKGTVQCGVPPDCEFNLDARAEVGRIGADFGLSSETVGRYGAVLLGKRGSERTKVVLRTGSGHLSFRAKQPHADEPAGRAAAGALPTVVWFGGGVALLGVTLLLVRRKKPG